MDRRITRNQYDTSGENLSRGMKAEEAFRLLAERHGYQVQRSTEDEDLHEHWDYLLSKDGQSIRVEVKAMKKIRRADPQPQDVYAWIELKGVRPGEPGWLFGGKSDYIAFETRTTFVLVKRVNLIAFVQKNTDTSAVVNSPEAALQKTAQGKYRVYQRRMNAAPDKMTLL